MSGAGKLKIFAQMVTYNSSSGLRASLRALSCQEGYRLGENLWLRVYDNASQDDSVKIVQSFREELGLKEREAALLIQNEENLGFALANNRGFAEALLQGADYVVLVNPDLALDPAALAKMVDALESDPRAGACCPKLLRADSELNPLLPKTIDAAGMFITPSIRHLDRGAEEEDRGQFDQPEYVFGGSGACLLFRKNCLRDICLPKIPTLPREGKDCLPVFDEEFFAYREDADLAWRMQWLGWKTLYLPSAVGFHVRRVVPERRKELPSQINSWSVRNRFLMQVNNLRLGVLGWGTFFAHLRNLQVILAVLFTERSSLPGLRQALSLFPRAISRRQELFRRRRVNSLQLRKWFSFKPFAERAAFSESTMEVPRIARVQAVIVSYGTAPLAKQLAEQLLKIIPQLDARLEIQIIENSPDGDAGSLEGLERLGVKVHRKPENLGFAGAINFARRNTESDALLILNPDISLEAEAIQKLLETLNRYSQISMVAPVLCEVDGRPQYGFTARRLPTFASVLAEICLLHRLFPDNPWTSALRMQDDIFFSAYLDQRPLAADSPQEALGRPLEVEQPAGACLLVRTTDFDSVGGFDERFYPAWFEDVDFCKRLRSAGRGIAVLGNSRVFHHGGVTKDLLPSERYLTFWYGNLIRYWKKHGTLFQLLVLRTVLPLALLVRAEIFFLLSLYETLRKNRKGADQLQSYSRDLLKVSLSCLRT